MGKEISLISISDEVDLQGLSLGTFSLLWSNDEKRGLASC